MQRHQQRDEPLGFVRGLCLGLCASLLLWSGIIGVFLALWR